MNRARLVQLGLGLVLMAVVAVPALAQPVAGVRVVETAFDGTNLDIDFFQYYVASYGNYSTAWIGHSDATGILIPAVSWGDGAYEGNAGPFAGTGIPFLASSTTVNGVNVDVYRGSFSHTYTDAPTSPVRVVSRRGLAVTTPITGNYYYAFSQDFATATLSLAAPSVPVIEVPTASEAGLLALALLLAGSAFVMIRRS